jgi:hypothetical protein
MRKSFLSLTILLVAALPAMADIGAVTLYITSPDDNSVLDLNPAVGIIDYGTGAIPDQIPVDIWWAATTEGIDGANVGIFGAFHNLTGTAIGDNSNLNAMTYSGSTLVPVPGAPTMGQFAYWGFGSDMGSYDAKSKKYKGPHGLGFNGLTDNGTGQADGIYGFGASQVTTAGSQDFSNLDAKWVGHPTGSHVAVTYDARNKLTPLLTATEIYEAAASDFYNGSFDPVADPAGPGVHAYTGVINLTGNPGWLNLRGSASLWVADGSATASAATTGADLLILPEPTTIGLLAPLALFLVRRRRA